MHICTAALLLTKLLARDQLFHLLLLAGYVVRTASHILQSPAHLLWLPFVNERSVFSVDHGLSVQILDTTLDVREESFVALEVQLGFRDDVL